MKKISVAIIILMCVSMLSCARDGSQTTAVQEGTSAPGDNISYSYNVDISSVEDILTVSDSVCRAELLSAARFTQTENIYTFSCEKNYAGTAAGEFTVIDAASMYTAGHTYYLCLNRCENALFKSAYYTSAVKEFVFDSADGGFEMNIAGKIIKASLAEFEETLSVSVDKLASALPEKAGSFRVNESEDFSEIYAQSDCVLLIKATNERALNEYCSEYDIEILENTKGDSVSYKVFALPPKLSEDEKYYIFLKKDPVADNDYILFARNFTAVPENSGLLKF